MGEKYKGIIRYSKKEIYANTLKELKREASLVCNTYRKPLDEMDVYFKDRKMFCLYRMNNKNPANGWKAGEWR